LRIWLRHSCWPPPSQQVESECPRFGNLEGYVRSPARSLARHGKATSHKPD
jgi:hypothetical protein